MFARLILALVCVLPAASALAEIITYDFSGHSLEANPKPVSGSFSYDLSTNGLLTPFPPFDTLYISNTPHAFTFQYDGFSVDTNLMGVSVRNQPNEDGLIVARQGNLENGGYINSSLEFIGPPTIFSSTELPTSVNLNDFTFKHRGVTSTNDFSAVYTVDSLTLRQPEPPRVPKTHVLSVAIADEVFDVGRGIGNGIAGRIATSFGRLQGVSTVWTLELTNERSSDKDNKQEIFDAIDTVHANMQPGDNFIFYIYTHGGYDLDDDAGENQGDEPFVTVKKDIVLYQNGTFTLTEVENSGDEYLRVQYPGLFDINDDKGKITDDELHDVFADEKWVNMQKLFILDSCYSGGFWNEDTSLGDSGDLSTLENAALLAASKEGEPTYAYTDDSDNPGYFSIALERVLNQQDPNHNLDILGLFPTIKQEAEHDYIEAKLLNRPVLFTGFPEDNWGIPLLLSDIPEVGFLSQTDGFQLTITVPEPTSSCTCSLAVIFTLIYTWRYGRKYTSYPYV